MLNHATELLHQVFGHADFRPVQKEIIESVLAGKDTLALFADRRRQVTLLPDSRLDNGRDLSGC